MQLKLEMTLLNAKQQAAKKPDVADLSFKAGCHGRP